MNDILNSPAGRRLIAADISARQRAVGPDEITIDAVGPDATVIRFTNGFCAKTRARSCSLAAVVAVARTLLANMSSTFGFRRVECARCLKSVSIDEETRHDHQG